MEEVPSFSSDPQKRQEQAYAALIKFAAVGKGVFYLHKNLPVDPAIEQTITDRVHEVVQQLDFNVAINRSALSRTLELSMENRHSGIVGLVLPKYKIAAGEDWEKPLGSQPEGHTFVRYAVMCGEPVSAKMFLDAKANPDAALVSNNATPIVTALARYKRAEGMRDLDLSAEMAAQMANLLLDYDADPTIKSRYVGSAVDIARRAKNEIDAELLGRIEGIAAKLEAQRTQNAPKRRWRFGLRAA